ncbi:MAG: YfhO family protein [Bacilli bacterium]
MKREKKVFNKSPYLITLGVILGIFLLLFLIKGIFPFGENSLIWGDMHDQVTAFYYHFYDAFYGNGSLLIDFSTSGGINFFGILTYYLLSPFSLLILLFPRENIYQAISLIIVFKVALSGLTSLYFFLTNFKKLPHYISVLLALLYAFCGYNIVLYQITAWIDIVYLFPLLLIGMKKLLDLEKPYLYILILTACLIFCFYLSGILLFFVLFSSLIYLYFYSSKEKRKKAIVSLGIATVISLLLAACIIIPTLLEISISSRMGFNLNNLLNSNVGPLGDKISFFITAGFSLVGVFLLYKKGHKLIKHKPFLGFLGMNLLLLFIPVIVEPVNKLWHLGSYAFFPLRIGFVLLLFLLIGCAYYFNNLVEERALPKAKIGLSWGITIVSICIMVIITLFNYDQVQRLIFNITLKDAWLAIILIILFLIVTIISISLILYFNNYNYDKKTFTFIWLIVLTNIILSTFLYFGMDFASPKLNGVYQNLQSLEETYTKGDYGRVKSIYPGMVMNHGMVSKYHSLDHFTSLTDRNNIETLRYLGYSSFWVKTYSQGGSLFSDALLANQYLISASEYLNPYYNYISTKGNINFYKHRLTIPYGYMIDHNESIQSLTNAFAVENAIYYGITGYKEPIFEVNKTNWDYHNLTIIPPVSLDKPLTGYKIIDEQGLAYLEKTIFITGKNNLYLEMLRSVDNSINKSIFKTTNIYINNKLFIKDYPSELNNGLLDLGIYENEQVTIRIEFTESINLKTLEIGLLNLDKYEDFVTKNNFNKKIDYQNNQIKVELSSDKEQVLFLPVTYNEGYQTKVNGEKVETLKLFDNYLGIPLKEGDNRVEITFMPPGLKLGIVISLCTLVLIFIFFKFNLYKKVVSSKTLGNIAFFLYLGVVGLLLVSMYLIPIICFFLSFFFKIRL